MKAAYARRTAGHLVISEQLTSCRSYSHSEFYLIGVMIFEEIFCTNDLKIQSRGWPTKIYQLDSKCVVNAVITQFTDSSDHSQYLSQMLCAVKGTHGLVTL